MVVNEGVWNAWIFQRGMKNFKPESTCFIYKSGRACILIVLCILKSSK